MEYIPRKNEVSAMRVVTRACLSLKMTDNGTWVREPARKEFC